MQGTEANKEHVVPGWSPEFENLIVALEEDGERQKREQDMRAHIDLLNRLYYESKLY